MAEHTKIQWATHTWNPWKGCEPKHLGCDQCYAQAYFKRFGIVGRRVKTSDAYWRQPLKWNREAEASGIHPRVFPSLCDPFELFADDYLRVWRSDMFDLIDATPHLDWLLLTKRPENIRRMWPGALEDFGSGRAASFRENCWLIYSASDQQSLEAGLPHLLACRELVPVLGLSLEPLVGLVDLSVDGLWNSACRRCADYLPDPETGVIECRACDSTGIGDETEIDWVIIGGESGPHARPCALEWIDDVRRQCEAAKVSVFIKQLGSQPVTSNANIWEFAYPLKRIQQAWGNAAAGCHIHMDDPKGGDPSEWPESLHVRQFPVAQRQVPPELLEQAREALDAKGVTEVEPLQLDGEDDATPSGRPDPWAEDDRDEAS